MSAYANQTTHSLARNLRFLVKEHRPIVVMTSVFLVVLILLVLTQVIPLWSLVTGTIDGTRLWALLIQCLVLGIATMALVRAVRYSARVSIERDFSATVGLACDDEISAAIKGKQREPIGLAEVPKAWPSAPEPNLVSMRLCSAIHADAYDRQFGSKEVMLQYYRDESNDAVDAIGDSRRIALHLGILGTFFGLVFAMPSLVGITDGKINVATFGGLFSSLEVSFSTSIVGLAAAIFISGLVSYALQQQRRFFAVLESTVSSLSIVVRNAHNLNELAPTLAQLQDRLTTVSRAVIAQNERLAMQTDLIEKGLESLAASKGDLDSFLEGVDRLASHIVGTVDDVTNKIDEAAYLDRIDGVVSATLESIGTSLGESVAAAYAPLDSAGQAVQTSRDALERSVDAMGKHLEVYDREASTTRESISTALRASCDTVVDVTRNSLSAIGQSVAEDAENIRSEREWMERLIVEHTAALTQTANEFDRLTARVNQQEKAGRERHEALMQQTQGLAKSIETALSNKQLRSDVVGALQTGFSELREQNEEAARNGVMVEATGELKRIGNVLGRLSQRMAESTKQHERHYANGHGRFAWWESITDLVRRSKPR